MDHDHHSHHSHDDAKEWLIEGEINLLKTALIDRVPPRRRGPPRRVKQTRSHVKPKSSPKVVYSIGAGSMGSAEKSTTTLTPIAKKSPKVVYSIGAGSKGSATNSTTTLTPTGKKSPKRLFSVRRDSTATTANASVSSDDSSSFLRLLDQRRSAKRRRPEGMEVDFVHIHQQQNEPNGRKRARVDYDDDDDDDDDDVDTRPVKRSRFDKAQKTTTRLGMTMTKNNSDQRTEGTNNSWQRTERTSNSWQQVQQGTTGYDDDDDDDDDEEEEEGSGGGPMGHSFDDDDEPRFVHEKDKIQNQDDESSGAMRFSDYYEDKVGFVREKDTMRNQEESPSLEDASAGPTLNAVEARGKGFRTEPAEMSPHNQEEKRSPEASLPPPKFNTVEEQNEMTGVAPTTTEPLNPEEEAQPELVNAARAQGEGYSGPTTMLPQRLMTPSSETQTKAQDEYAEEVQDEQIEVSSPAELSGRMTDQQDPAAMSGDDLGHNEQDGDSEPPNARNEEELDQRTNERTHELNSRELVEHQGRDEDPEEAGDENEAVVDAEYFEAENTETEEAVEARRWTRLSHDFHHVFFGLHDEANAIEYTKEDYDNDALAFDQFSGLTLAEAIHAGCEIDDDNDDDEEEEEQGAVDSRESGLLIILLSDWAVSIVLLVVLLSFLHHVNSACQDPFGIYSNEKFSYLEPINVIIAAVYRLLHWNLSQK